MSEELRLLRERVERLDAAVGKFRGDLLGCVAVGIQPWQAITSARGVAEALAKKIQTDIGRKPGEMLDKCLSDLESPEVRSRGLVPAEVLSCLRLAHILGNKAAHDAMGIEPTALTVVTALGAVLEVVQWYFCTFDRCPTKLDRIYAPSPEGDAPQPPRSPIGARLFQLPSVVADFTGRQDEFERMVARLCAGDGKVGVSALRGMGGVGKTSLAVKVAHQVKLHFPHAQLVLDLWGMSEQPMTAVEAMGRVIHAFDPTEQLPKEEVDLRNRYTTVLEGKRALIVLDNAKDEEQVKHLVTVPPPVGFIITSRMALALDAVESIWLDLLPPDESLTLLRGIVGAKGTDDELRTVAELCGRLPLALRVAGDLLRLKTNWTLPWFIERVREEQLRWLRIHGDPQKDVEAVLTLSAAQLVRDNDDLATRWHFLAEWPGDFAMEAAAEVWDIDPDDPVVIEDLSELMNRSLILYDQESCRYRLHDLMRPIAKGLFP